MKPFGKKNIQTGALVLLSTVATQLLAPHAHAAGSVGVYLPETDGQKILSGKEIAMCKQFYESKAGQAYQVDPHNPARVDNPAGDGNLPMTGEAFQKLCPDLARQGLTVVVLAEPNKDGAKQGGGLAKLVR